MHWGAVMSTSPVSLVCALTISSLTLACGSSERADSDAGTDADASIDGGSMPDGGKEPTPRLAPSDVAVLFPLPTSLAATSALTLDAKAAGGALLSEARFDDIEVFAEGAPPEFAYDRFRIVAMRVDPCFPDLAALEINPAACQRQIRLVAQPLSELDGVVRAEDAAIHLLYDLEAERFNEVVDALVALRGDRPIDPKEVLGVSPVLADEGEKGPIGAALRALILEHVGPKQLRRFTFVRGDENFSWHWGGRDVGADGKLSKVVIPGITPNDTDDGTSQTIGANVGLITVAPATPFSEKLESLMGDDDCGPMPPIGCAEFALKHTAEEIRTGLETAFAIENPNKNSPETVDCASCHEAGPLRARAEQLGKSTEDLDRFSSRTWNLTLGNRPEQIGAPNQVRAFGYFHTDSILSQRTVNEAAAVADALNAMLSARSNP